MRIVFLLLFGLVSRVQAQDTVFLRPADNTVYLEVLGQALYYSLAYDRIVQDRGNTRWSVSGGLTALPIDYMEVYAASVSGNFLYGRGNHLLELGFGLCGMQLIEKDINSSFYVEDEFGNPVLTEIEAARRNLFLFVTPKIGYRYQRRTGGFFARATLTPPVGILSHWGPLVNVETGESNGSGYTLIFKEAAFFPSVIFPWFGISFGYSFR